jgi:hypothetical protein
VSLPCVTARKPSDLNIPLSSYFGYFFTLSSYVPRSYHPHNPHRTLPSNSGPGRRVFSRDRWLLCERSAASTGKGTTPTQARS